jgi:hypothetical protein
MSYTQLVTARVCIFSAAVAMCAVIEFIRFGQVNRNESARINTNLTWSSARVAEGEEKICKIRD